MKLTKLLLPSCRLLLSFDTEKCRCKILKSFYGLLFVFMFNKPLFIALLCLPCIVGETDSEDFPLYNVYYLDILI